MSSYIAEGTFIRVFDTIVAIILFWLIYRVSESLINLMKDKSAELFMMLNAP
jgi:hypothetical protein